MKPGNLHICKVPIPAAPKGELKDERGLINLFHLKEVFSLHRKFL